jgi:hypothetical protein
MLQELNIHTLRSSIRMCQLVANLRNANPQGDNDAFVRSDNFFGNFVKSIYRPPNDTYPGFYYADCGASGFLALDGTATLAQAAGVVDGYVGGVLESLDVLGSNQNFFFAQAAREITAILQGVGILAPYQLYIGGWSLGGATGFYFPSPVIPSSWRPGVISIDTFGSPRPGGRDWVTAMESTRYIFRWMNDNDPVSLVPPRVTDFPALLAVFGVRGAVRSARFVQPHGGYSIGIAGTPTPATVPALASPNFTASLVNWLQSWNDDRTLEHGIWEYLRRLRAMEVVITPVFRGHGGPIELANPIRPQQVTATERAVAQTVLHLERSQNQNGVALPEVRIFKAVRISGLWFVTFNGASISTAGSKRGARRLANQGNAFLRTLQTRPVVDPAALQQQLSDYLKAAGAVGGQFVPRMNFAFPLGG